MSASNIDWDTVQESAVEMDTEEFLNSGLDDDKVDTDIIGESFDQPDADGIITPRTQSTQSKAYEKKAKKVLSRAFHFTVRHPATVADSAAILFYQKDLAHAAGEFADANTTARNVLDFLTEGSENPVAAFVFAAAPLVFQIARNHENFLEPKPRGGVKIPFTKRRVLGGLRLGMRLGRWRAITHEPQLMVDQAFGNPGVIRAMEKAGLIKVEHNATANGKRR